ncbi:Aste57867_19076 [Aphanomyces stellatus]|uniref:Aste57867_19076 protein n=1 Tax=Aphanomyces stellatus TaxID=120398 RepID=A0A485LD62_9STRA|nr:hypothetical protein As57867_019012 [Aphanomyces stellatus]VFT95801.1 Aste57867_19076 [Aphanomyces stellatus]
MPSAWRRKRPHVLAARPLPPVDAFPTSPRHHGANNHDLDKAMHRQDDSISLASPDTRPFHNLLTLAGLAQIHASHLYAGNFVARSKERWASHQARPRDHVLARCQVEESAAVAMQSAVRMWLAKRRKHHLVRACLHVQETRAAWVGRLHIPITAAWTRFSQDASLTRLFPITAVSLPAQGAVYALAATLLQCQLTFHSALRVARHVRKPAPLRLFIASAVVDTCRRLHQLRRAVAYTAALVLQCKVRCRHALHRRRHLAQIRARHVAAAVIQRGYRCYVARRARAYLRDRRASLAIQCAFRCHLARRRAIRQRYHHTARTLVVSILRAVVPAVAESICHRAAQRIQRVQRGRAARSRFRTLALQNETARLARSPVRGYMVYAAGQYFDAALLLEQAFLHGIDGDDEFWAKFGTAHFYSYEATGDRAHLEKALAAFRRLLVKASDIERRDKARLGLGLLYAKALFYSHHFTPCLAIATAFLDYVDVMHQEDDNATTTKKAANVDKEAIAVAHVLAANITFDMHQMDTCAAHLVATLALGPLATYSELELRFMLGTVYALVAQEKDVGEAAPAVVLASVVTTQEDDKAKNDGDSQDDHTVIPDDTASVDVVVAASGTGGTREADEAVGGATVEMRGREEDAPPDIAVDPPPTVASDTLPPTDVAPPPLPPVAVVVLSESAKFATLAAAEHAQCFAMVELWPGRGFYHGVMGAADAEALLEPTPVGTFLVHRVKTMSSFLYVKVKWGEKDYTAMKVTRDSATGMYTNPNSPAAADTTLLGFLAKLPPAAGIHLRNGLRSTTSPGTAIYGLDTATTVDEWKTSDDAWLWAAHHWELHSGYVFAAFLAAYCPAAMRFKDTQDARKKKTIAAAVGGWHKRPSASTDTPAGPIDHTQADACLIQAKAARGLGKLLDSLTFIQHAVALTPSVECIRRSWMAKSPANAFGPAFRRIQKYDRLWSRALAFDTYTPRTYGQPQREVLVLECLYQEFFHACATVDIHRRLVRAHVRAYCVDGLDVVHLTLACRSMDELAVTWQRQHALSTAFGAPNVARDPAVPKPRKPAASKRASKLDVKMWSVELLMEMAEVAYRSLQLTRAIDTLQVLSRRTARAAYSHVHHTALLRLAFLFAHVRQFSRAVATMDQLLETMDAPTTGGAVPRWPVSTAFTWTKTEVRFLRGVVYDLHATDADNAKARDVAERAQANAYTDFTPLHTELVAHVQAILRDEATVANSAEFRADHVSGVIVTVGESHGLYIANIIKANVRVVVKVEGVSVSTATPPSWETMQPNWNLQTVTAAASSKHAVACVTIVNKVQLRDVVLGTLHFPLSNLFATGVWYADVARSHDGYLDALGHVDGHLCHLKGPDGISHACSATLWLAFQLTTRKPVLAREAKEKRHIAFALGDFLNQSFVWELFATRFVGSLDHFLARHFLLQALRRLPPPHDARTVRMMLDLARCDLACRGGGDQQHTQAAKRHEASALEWLQKAHVAALGLDPRQPPLENAILDVMQQAMMHESAFERQLRRCLQHPIASDYVAVTSDHGTYYVNKDNGDCVLDEPLGYEPQLQKPPIRRMVVFSDAMKSRILRLRQVMKETAAMDPDQWVAMYDEFHSRMFYVSQVHSMQSYSRPERYVMVGDEMTVYSVLVIQDVYRLRRLRARVRRLFRRAVRVVCLVRYMLDQWRARERARAIRAAKVPLTCLKLTIESADDLRAADTVSSDPFVQIEWPGCRHGGRRTSVRKATLQPEWNEVFHLRYAWLDHEQAMLAPRPSKADDRGHDSDDDDDDDDENEMLHHIDINRIASALAHNLVMNEDEGIESSADGPTLTLTVLDYDAPTLTNKTPKCDFLGLVVVPLDPLDHGRPVTAELTLRDEDGYLSPRPRGTLTISIQWIEYRFPLSLRTAMTAAHAAMRLDRLKQERYIERAKTQAPPRKSKPMMTDDVKMLLELINSTWQDALVKLADAIVMADQLQRLVLRLAEARKSAMNADEVEHIERRLKAVIRDQFHIKRHLVDDAMGVVAKGLRSFGKVTYADVHGYVESGGDVVLQEKVQLWYTNIGFKAVTPRGDGQRDGDETFDRIMQYVLTTKERFVTWETSLRNIVEGCFDGGTWAFDMSKELAICRKIEATLNDTPEEMPQLTPEEEERIKQRQQVRAKKLDKQKKKTVGGRGKGKAK